MQYQRRRFAVGAASVEMPLNNLHINKEIKTLIGKNSNNKILCETDIKVLQIFTCTFKHFKLRFCIFVVLKISIKVCFEKGDILICSDLDLN